MVNVCIAGAAGRMGRTLLEACDGDANLNLVSATEYSASPFLGTDSGLLGISKSNDVIISDDLDAAMTKADVCIDFTRPEPTLLMLERALTHNCAAVIGTTGFTPDEKAQLVQASKQIPIVFAANFSVGVTVHLKLIAEAARLLGDSYDVEIIEAHHRFKVDAPSGTALKMGEVVADALGRDLNECAVYGREGHTGERESKTIGFETIRGGDIVGDHTVLFAGIGERIEVTHKASNRMTFANGAVRAASWVVTQPAGLYDMTHVLGL